MTHQDTDCSAHRHRIHAISNRFHQIINRHDDFILLVDQASQLGRLVAKGFALGNSAYEPQIEVRYCQTAAALVADGMGLTVVDPYSAKPYLDRGLVARPFMPACEIRASVLTRKGVPHSSTLLSFMDTVRASINS